MKNILFFLCFLTLNQALGQNTEVKLGADVWPPFTDTSENTSILTVLVQEALYRRNINSDIEFDTWKNVMNKIDGGELDGSPALWESYRIQADIDGDGVVELVLGGEMAGSSAPQNIYGLMMDQSFRQTNEPKQYYVDGKLYESWDDIPKSYKLDLPKDDTPTEEDAKVKLKF